MDNELFELCKEVYKRTRWNAPHDKVFVINDILESDTGIKKPSSFKLLGYGVKSGAITYWPLYTSDYLLEKLPATGYRGSILTVKKYESVGDFTYGASYGVFGAEQISDTPLKALLKLTLALHKAGKL